MKQKRTHAMMLAILAAVFYAVSVPVEKVLLNECGPTMMAAFLYLGAGIGISILFLLSKNKADQREKLTHTDLPYVIGMILLDIAAPILLMNGAARTTAANVSLLSNFEIAATALIAFFAFREKISGRMWLALVFITLSSLVLSFEGSDSLRFSAGSLMVIIASACWGLENNCTRMLSAKNTYEIVMLKGLCSGTGSLIIALLTGESFPSLSVTGAALLLGFVAYGLSIFTYIRAQRVIGAAKTSAFYALAPFIAAFLSFVFLQEQLASTYLAGFALMAVGSVLAVLDTLQMPLRHIQKSIQS